MYQALYRKYRPVSFDDVVGQDAVVRTLKNAIKNGSISHAYLFAGPRGTGKTSVAKILANTVNCSDVREGLPCGKCVVCTQIKEKSFIDIVEIDAASNNGVDEIRELRNKINLVPSSGKYKVYIIDEVHMLTTGAFNALLKTLEEPPKHAIFILATTEPQKIPSTVLSRCQRFDFKKINNEAMYDRIKEICDKEKITIGASEIKEIACLSDGGMRDALSLLDQVLAYSDEIITSKDIHAVNGTITKQQLLEFSQYIFKGDLYNILKTIDDWSQNGKNLSKISDEIINFLKDLLIYLNAPKYFENDKERIDQFAEITQNLVEENVISYIEELNEVLYKMKKSSNSKLLLELVFIKMIQSNRDKQKAIGLSVNDINTNKKEQTSKKQVKNDIINIDEKYKKQISNLKEIRIENTLAAFDKRLLLDLKKQQDDIKSLLIDVDYSKYASMVLDGELKAASPENLIYVYSKEEMADLFNQNILDIENTLEKVFNKKYKVIATDIISWEIIKKDFNNKAKQYIIKDEPSETQQILRSREKNNEIENLFENKIIYN